MSFRGDMLSFGKEVAENAVKALELTTLAAFQGVITRSPVDEGRFRSNWNLSTVAPDSNTTDRTQKVVFGSMPNGNEMAKFTSLRETLKAGDIVYISNNLPYAEPLEEGHSPQASGGIIEPTRVEVQAKIDGGALEGLI